MTQKKNKIIIIGAGFGGLSTACYLARAGHQVTILEKNNQVGGRASTWYKDGFLFDLGPSWYLMPDVFENFFRDFNHKPSDFYFLKRLDPSYRVYFGIDKYLDLPADFVQMKKIFKQLEPNGDLKLEKYLDQVGALYQTAMAKFIYRPFDSLSSLLDTQLIKEWQTLLSLLQSFDAFASKYFESNEAKKILEYVNVFLGGSPHNTPALYSILSYVDMKLGVWYPMKGFGEVPKAMAKIAKNLGVKIILNQEVNQLSIHNGHITQVQTATKIYPGDYIVSNADYTYTETHLLPSAYQSYPQKYWSKKTFAPSAFLIYLGLNVKLKNVRHHTLFLDNHWDNHFDQIFKNPAWPKNPSYYLCTPSVTDPSVAPKGQENLFILVPVAVNLSDNETIRDQYFEKIISHLEKVFKQPIKSHIIVKRIFAHTDFLSRYHAYQGTALGLAHTLGQTAMFRPKTRSRKVDNLYYCGSYTHPGIGTAPSVISGKITANLIQKRLI